MSFQIREEEGRKREARNSVRSRNTRYRRWNSTVLHPRLLDTIVSHRYPPSSVSNRQPLVAPSPQPSFIGNRMKGFTSETLRFSRLEEHGFPPFLGSPFWQVWQGCTGNTDKLDGIKFLPLEKYRVRWFVDGIFLENPMEILLCRKLRTIIEYNSLRISCICSWTRFFTFSSFFKGKKI